MSAKRLKVTDKRMFTPEGELRAECSFLEQRLGDAVVLRRKTTGNLSAREPAYLENVLYQLRMLYVQKRG